MKGWMVTATAVACSVAIGSVAAEEIPDCKVSGSGAQQVKLITVKTATGTVALNGAARALRRIYGWTDGADLYEPDDLLQLTQDGLVRCTGAAAAPVAEGKAATHVTETSPVVPKAEPLSVDVFKKAADTGDIETVRRYIAMGFDVNSKDKGMPALDIPGSPAIDAAAASGHCEILDELIAAGAEVDPGSIKFGYTPLVLASQRGAPACVSSLIARKVRLDVRTEPGGNVCYGPRGGRYCITSGGKQRYGI